MAGNSLWTYDGHFRYDQYMVFLDFLSGSMQPDPEPSQADRFETLSLGDISSPKATDRDVEPITPPNIIGTDSDDELMGHVSNAKLEGLTGDNVFYGGLGFDTVVFSGSQASYTLEINASGMRIIDRRDGGDGTDELYNVEMLKFEVGSFDFSLDGFDLTMFDSAADVSQSDLIDFIEFYIAYFNRAPDSVGLLFWADAFAEGTSLERMAELFIEQDETSKTYPEDMSTEAFATAVYDNVLGRVPDQVGFAFWVDQLDRSAETGVTRDQFILAVLRGVQDGSADRAYLDAKIEVGAYFAVHKGMSDVENAREVMEYYDGTQAGIDAAISAVDEFYREATDPVEGEFLLKLVGVLEDPFAVS